MTLEDWANIGEIVGAIGVVASLVYLAVQVRHNSEHIKENTASLQGVSEAASEDGSRDVLITSITNPELIMIQRKGDSGEALNEIESAQYTMMLRVTFNSHQTYFIQHARGLTGDEIWEYWVRMFRKLTKAPGVRRWWSKAGKDYDQNFQTYIDDLMTDAAAD